MAKAKEKQGKSVETKISLIEFLNNQRNLNTHIRTAIIQKFKHIKELTEKEWNKLLFK